MLTESRRLRLEVGPGLAGRFPSDAAAQIAGAIAQVDRAEDSAHRNPIVWTIYAMSAMRSWLGPMAPDPPSPQQLELDRRAHRTNLEVLADDLNDGDYGTLVILLVMVGVSIVLLVLLVTHPILTLQALFLSAVGGVLGGSSSGGSGGGDFAGGGGSFGGGGSSGRW